MTHVFVAPHPDDVALSCGGLIAGLRELGQNVTILTVFSGAGPTEDGRGGDTLSTYQREALGFGSKTMWPVSEAFNRSHISADYPVYGDPNSKRAPLHHQLDLRVDYNWKWGPTALTAFLDVQNIYMNESVVTYFYGYDFTQRAAFTSIPIIPSIGLRGVL